MCLPLGIRYSRAWSVEELPVLGERRDDDLALALGVLAEAHLAVDLGDDGVILRLAGLEELGDTGQTARDVLRLRGLARDLGEDVAGVDLVAVLDDDVGANRQEVPRVERAGRELQRLAGLGSLIEMRGRRSACARLDDDLARQAGDLVELLGHRDALDDVAELHDAADLGEDRHGEGVPLGEELTGLDLVALVDLEHRAVD